MSVLSNDLTIFVRVILVAGAGMGKRKKKEAIGWIKQKNSIDLNWTGPEKFDKCNILLSIYNKLNCAKAEPSGISKYFNIINTKVMIRYI